jgi:putative endonuclease
MFFIYVIRNTKNNWYIGYTHNLKIRLKQHNQNESYTTKRLGGPWKIIYIEGCLNEYDAKKRERFLKTTHGYAFLKNRLKYFLSQTNQ